MVLRDVFIAKLYEKMETDKSVFFVSADLGSPALDQLRNNFPESFINVGIAEQNLVGVAAGLALEGYKVFAYAIAPFLSMRAYEQLRTSVSLMSQIKDININFISVGSGLSYDVTGPTHHCLEDSCVINVLPNFTIFSPSDPLLTESFVDYALEHSGPKYIRLEGKPQPQLHRDQDAISIENGFIELRSGNDVCIVSTGYMTHVALKIAQMLKDSGISPAVFDVYMLKPFADKVLAEKLKTYKHVVSMEESFLNKGSLDSKIENLCFSNGIFIGMTKIGFEDKYVFDVGNREHLYEVNGLGLEMITQKIINDCRKKLTVYDRSSR